MCLSKLLFRVEVSIASSVSEIRNIESQVRGIQDVSFEERKVKIFPWTKMNASSRGWKPKGPSIYDVTLQGGGGSSEV